MKQGAFLFAGFVILFICWEVLRGFL